MTLSPGWIEQSPRVQKMFRDLITGAIDKQVPCLNRPEKWVDYEEDNPPDRWEANKMCFGCPIRRQCLEYAKASGASFGVYGGEVFDGRG